VARDRAARPGAKPWRLFVAIEVPDAAKHVVSRATEELRTEFPKARWVPVENWHVTMKFLGATYPRLVAWARSRLAWVAEGSAPFETSVTGMGTFPSAARARVLWAGLDDASGRMARLAAVVDDALAKEFRPEARAFTAHLTVARSDPPMRLPAAVGDLRVASDPFTVEELVLFRSHLRRPAPVYEPIERFPLEG
jgi:RNA 2',3'-cyclic 3'-phosphodiesterase